MKREMTLDEFKEFCRDRDEMRYIANWKNEAAKQFCDMKMELEKIAVCVESHVVRLSSGGNSVKFQCVEKAMCAEDPFGNIEVELICRIPSSSRLGRFYIFFPCIKNRT